MDGRHGLMVETLAYTDLGSGPPLVILHGLFGSARNWATVAKRLATARRVLALDLRNHGASPWTPGMDYPDMARDVARFVASHALGPVEVIGHSMGGKVAMCLALAEPALVRRPIVVDIAPVAYGHAFSAPYAEAMLAIDLARHDTRRAVDRELARSLPDPVLRGFLMTNLVRADGGGGGGGLRWGVNLEAIVRNGDALMDFPETATSYAGPALFVGGARSNYLGADAEAAVSRYFPAAGIARIAEAGHWVHAEAPEAFLGAVAAFLDLDLSG
jgi:pimeloyl-ACP methyl ester carboxylesterase